jgi:hypothetical protein
MGQISLCSIIAYNQVIVFKTDQIMIWLANYMIEIWCSFYVELMIY